MSVIKKFQIFRYLKKWLPLIVCFFLAMTFLAYKILAGRQSYTASAVIEYSNAGAPDGLAPDGSAIDVTEIASSSNMARVVENMKPRLSGYSLDKLCASIKVSAIVEKQAQDIQAAVNEDGLEYTVQPTSYVVSCTLGSSGSGSLARDILNELLDVYFSEYSNKHINRAQENNRVKFLIDTDYDYIEMVERIEKQLDETTSMLEDRYNWDHNFRSSATGYSFSDLKDQFDLIQEVNVPRLYSLILSNQITKDRVVLLDKYRNRIANYNLTSQNAQEDIKDILRVIDAYVSKMRESGNTDIDYNYILGNVYDREDHDSTSGSKAPTNRTIQYDALLRSWIASSDRWDYAVIDAAYCAYIISVYEGEQTSLAKGKSVSAAEVEQEIGEVINKMNALYDVVTETNTEYNEYLGAQNIKTLSSASVREGFNMSTYLFIIAMFFLVVGCCGAILLGRLGDILEYLFLRDSSTGCMNRVCCDRYIHERENLILSLGFSCVNIQITNQRELNESFGREETDRAFREFGRVLRELYENRSNGFVGYNGGGQFWVFFDIMPQESINQEVERLVITLKQRLSSVPVSYQMGAVNAGESAVFHIRGLITNAVKLREPHLTSVAGLSSGQQEEKDGKRKEDKQRVQSV